MYHDSLTPLHPCLLTTNPPKHPFRATAGSPGEAPASAERWHNSSPPPSERVSFARLVTVFMLCVISETESRAALGGKKTYVRPAGEVLQTPAASHTNRPHRHSDGLSCVHGRTQNNPVTGAVLRVNCTAAPKQSDKSWQERRKTWKVSTGSAFLMLGHQILRS